MKLASIILSFLLLLTIASVATQNSSAMLWGNALWVNALWHNAMEANSIAFSGDGNYLVAVNDTGLYFFEWMNPNPMWWYETSIDEHFKSVAVSADGRYVVVGDNIDGGYIYYFAGADEKNGLVAEPTWKSSDLGGSIETIDISDNGDYVAAGILTTTIHYFDDCTVRSGPRQSPTWYEEPLDGVVEVLAVDMSMDGKYVGVGGSDSDSGFVVFYKDAWNGPESKWVAPGWIVLTDIRNEIRDVAVSDDGYAVAAVEEEGLYYWSDSTALSGEAYFTWMNEGPYSSVDMSSDGDEVLAGFIISGTVFFRDARDLLGPEEEAVWNRLVGEAILDTAINDDGRIVAVTAQIGIASEYKACFFTSDGNLIGEFDLEQRSPLLSMSGDGSRVAVGGPGGIYVFEIKEIAVGGEVHPIDKGVLLAKTIYTYAESYWWIALIIATALMAFMRKRRH